jgi:secretion/DNA translocation related TadE-like protein
VTATPDAGGGPPTRGPAPVAGSATTTPAARGGPATPDRAPAGGPGELGGASLVALALAAFLLLAGLLAVDVGALAAARAGAQNAADMAALAALTPGGGSPSARAAAIAAANGAELAGCDCSAVQAVVKVRRRVLLAPTGLSVWVTARARAVLTPGPLGPVGSAQALTDQEPRHGSGAPDRWKHEERRDSRMMARSGTAELAVPDALDEWRQR